MLGNQLNKSNHHFLLLRNSAVTHILVTGIYTPLDCCICLSAKVFEPVLYSIIFPAYGDTAIVGEVLDVLGDTQTHLICFRLQLVFHLCPTLIANLLDFFPAPWSS